jgi:hypothetical protein
LRSEIPRELLWALLGAQAIFIIALWPKDYPYGQALKVDLQHQAENGVGRDNPAEHGPAAQKDSSRENQSKRSGENASEIFGIKPGEWLLSIVTLMLWGATVRLVRNSDKTAERQLRAYVDIKSAKVENFEIGEEPEINIRLQNVGQTPAKNVRTRMDAQIAPFNDPLGPFELMEANPEEGSRSNIGKDGDITMFMIMEPLTKHFYDAVRYGESALFVVGLLRYDDIFDNPHHYRFRMFYHGESIEVGIDNLTTHGDGNDSD